MQTRKQPSEVASDRGASAPEAVERSAPTVDWRPPKRRSSEPTPLTKIGKYTIHAEAGTGGMGKVFRCWDPDLGQFVALKILRSGRFAGEKERNYFRREARALARVRHPNVVRVHSAELDHDPAYIVVEWVPQGSLDQVREELKENARDAVAMVERIARAVHCIHQCGILHRDLKPANVLLDDHREPKVTDFGLAALVDTNHEATNSLLLAGTPLYMAPEQTRLRDDKISPATDVWALGVMLYELLTGERPFRGDNLFHRICTEDPPLASTQSSDLDPRLDAVVQKCLEKNPRRRFPSAEALADELARWLEGDRLQTTPGGLLGHVARAIRRRPLLTSAFCLSVFGVIAGLGLANLFRPEPQASNRGKSPTPAPGKPPIEVAREVTLTTHPPGAKVVFVPLDPVKGIPIPDQAVRPPRVTPLTVRLKPGLYWIEAASKNGEFHEVFRTVPTREKEIASSTYNHLYWQTHPDGTVELPSIAIPTRPAENMVLVAAGTLVQTRPNTTDVFLPAFYLEPTEVSWKEWKNAGMPIPVKHPLTDPSQAICNVAWDEVVAFAEKTGRRLPTREEFRFAATNRGESKLPWGDQIRDTWTFGPVGQSPLTDQTWGEKPIFGLASNVAEWTMSWGIPEARHPDRLPEHMQARFAHSRLVEGGTPEVFQRNAPTGDWSDMFSRPPTAVYRDVRKPGIGFRCARSRRPRFLEVP